MAFVALSSVCPENRSTGAGLATGVSGAKDRSTTVAALEGAGLAGTLAGARELTGESTSETPFVVVSALLEGVASGEEEGEEAGWARLFKLFSEAEVIGLNMPRKAKSKTSFESEFCGCFAHTAWRMKPENKIN